MNKLVPCPCGKTPTRLHVNDAGQGMKWAHVAGNCCGDWELEFRTEYNALDSEKCYQLAVERWNEAPRSATSEPTPNAALLELADEFECETDDGERAGLSEDQVYRHCAERIRTLAQRTPDQAGGFDVGGKLSESDARSLGLIEDIPDDEIDRRKDALEKRFRQLDTAQSELVERLRGLRVHRPWQLHPITDVVMKADLDALLKEVCCD